MAISTEFLIQKISMKKIGLELEQRSKELMVEKNFFRGYPQIYLDECLCDL